MRKTKTSSPKPDAATRKLQANWLPLADTGSEVKIPGFTALPTFKMETLSSLINKHGELHFQRHFGLRLIECRILGIVAHYGPVTLRQLCIELSLEKSQGSRFVARLVEAGLIDRREDPEDQRSFYLLLTTSGRAMRNRINVLAVERNNELLESLTHAQRTIFVDCLDLLTERAHARLAKEILDGGHTLPQQPRHESVEHGKEEKKPLLVDPTKLLALYQQLGELMDVKIRSSGETGQLDQAT